MNDRSHLFVVLLCTVALITGGCGSAGEESDEAATEVTVETGTIVRTTLIAHVSAYGSVDPAPAESGRPGGAAFLAAPLAGLVRDVEVSEGQRVATGDLVVRLDDRMAQAELDRARARAAYARQALERERALLDSQNTSQRQFEEAQQALAVAESDLRSAQGTLAQVQLRSPIDGIVSRLRVLPGQSVDANTVVAEIVDTGKLVVSANVPAAEASRVQIGQPAEVIQDGGDSTAVDARVSFVSPMADPGSGTVLVRLSLPRDSGLVPGRFVRVRISVEERTGRLAVPIASVFVDADGRGILHVVDGDTAYQHIVRVGLQDRDLIEVESTELTEGMTVVTTGAYALPETTKVRIMGREGL